MWHSLASLNPVIWTNIETVRRHIEALPKAVSHVCNQVPDARLLLTAKFKNRAYMPVRHD